MVDFSFTSSKFGQIDVKVKNKNYYVDQSFYGIVPHVMFSGGICLHANADMKIIEHEQSGFNEINEEYVKALFELGREQAVLEFLNEIEYYLIMTNIKKYSDKFNIKRKAIKQSKITNIVNYEIETTEDFHRFIESIFKDETEKISYDIYTSNTKIVEIRKDKLKVNYNYEFYEKNRLRVSRNLSKFNSKNVLFIGVGSVNSYIIKQMISEKPAKIDLVDPSSFKQSNALRHAFYKKNGKKAISTQKFINNVYSECLVNAYVTNFECTLNLDYENIDYIFISVDNLNSWFSCYVHLKACNLNPQAKVIFVGIDGYARYGKFLYISFADLNDNKLIQFLTYNSSIHTSRKMMVGAGCGSSTAIYTEYDLNKLAKETLIKDLSNIQEVSFENIT